MKTVCLYFYDFEKIESSQLHSDQLLNSDQSNIFNKILRGSEEKWKKQWSGPYILKARILTPTIPQKNLNFPQICPKMPQNGPKWP